MSEALGPNGHRTGYNDEGDFVEWLPDDDDSGEEWPMILRRSDDAIHTEYDELWGKVWYYRQRIWMEKDGLTVHPMEQSAATMLDIEAKHGRENLVFDDFEWGMLQGKMMALAWVTGAEWEESGDT